MIFLISQSDIWVSALLFGPVETGYYVAASRLVFLTTFFAVLLNGLFTPRLSRLAVAEDLQPFEDMLRAVSALNAMTGLAVAILLAIFAKHIIYLIFGGGFEDSTVLLRILLFGQVGSLIVGPVGYALVVLNRSQALFVAALFGLAASIGSLAFFSIGGISQVEIAMSFALGNIVFQLAMFTSLNGAGVSALPSTRKLRGLISD